MTPRTELHYQKLPYDVLQLNHNIRRSKIQSKLIIKKKEISRKLRKEVRGKTERGNASYLSYNTTTLT